MAHKHCIVRPGKTSGIFVTDSGEQLILPDDWAFLAAGDAAITKSVKSKGVTWVVQIRRGGRSISQGIWAKKSDITESHREVEAKRKTPEYARRRKAELARRTAKQEKYVMDFCAAVVCFLDFHPRYAAEAELLGREITEHATPVGSGTVARTERIPIVARAEAATIAWMRHQTTSYDSMKIARIKGKRREIRRYLAEQSVEVLRGYRQGEDPGENCPLKNVLVKTSCMLSPHE